MLAGEAAMNEIVRSQYVNMSICQYVYMLICQYVNMSICQYVNMSICQYVQVIQELLKITNDFTLYLIFVHRKKCLIGNK